MRYTRSRGFHGHTPGLWGGGQGGRRSQWGEREVPSGLHHYNLQDLGNREVIPSGINLEKGKQIASFGFYFAVLFGFVYLGSFQLEISRNSPVVHFSSNAGCESCGDLNAQRAHTSAGRRAGARGGGSAPGTLLVTGPSPPPRRPSPPGQQTPALELGS